jgi:hypothetical protein
VAFLDLDQLGPQVLSSEEAFSVRQPLPRRPHPVVVFSVVLLHHPQHQEVASHLDLALQVRQLQADFLVPLPRKLRLAVALVSQPPWDKQEHLAKRSVVVFLGNKHKRTKLTKSYSKPKRLNLMLSRRKERFK